MKEDLYKYVEKNEFGYYVLSKQYQKSMNDFYENEYFQEDKGAYKKKYSSEELLYMNNLFREKEYILMKNDISSGKFLDIGCSEGYALKYFYDNGWDAKGIDYSDYGIKTHNPDMIVNLIKGDAFHSIYNFSETFDFINMDNILEHLHNPIDFLKILKNICNESTILCAKVPNDFSITQIKLFENNCINHNFWVTKDTSEHFNYFTTTSLKKLIENNSFHVLDLISDWPIDFNLFNPQTNYLNKNVGKECHQSRIAIENMFFEESLEKTINLHRVLADLGVGRNITIYFKLKI